jgi:hypothetical protein
VAKVQAMLARGELQAGTIVNISVRHDDWCKLLRRGKACNCNPALRS